MGIKGRDDFQVMDKTILIGVGLGVVYWILESLIDTFFSNKRGNISVYLFQPNYHEFWHRSLFIGLVITFGVYAHLRIAKHRQAQQALNDSRHLLQITHDTIPDAIITTDQNYTIISCNPAVHKILGYSPEELVGKGYLTIVSERMTKDPQQRMREKELSERGYLTSEEFYFKRKDGTEFPGSFSVSLIEAEDGKFAGLVGTLRDITERKASVEALRESEERYRQAVENSPNPIFSVDRKGRIQTWNRACEQLLQYPANQILNRKYHRLLWDSNQRETIEKILQQVWQGQVQRYKDLIYRCQDGTLLYTVSRFYPIRDKEGKVQECVFANTDITERKLAEDQLQHRLDLEAAVARASQLFFAAEGADLDGVLRVLGRAIKTNRAYIFRFREQGAKVDNTHEWCAPGTEPQIDNLQDLDSDLFPWWMELMHQDQNILIPDVEALPLEAAAEKELLQAQDIRSLLVVPIRTATGELTGFMGFDDTERCRKWAEEDALVLRVVAEMVGLDWDRRQANLALRESEQRYSDVVNNLDDILFQTDEEGRWVFLNPAWNKIMGFSVEESLGQLFLDYVYPEDRERNIELFKPLVEGKKDFCRHEIRYQTKDKQIRWIEVFGRLSFDKEGNITGTVGTLTDITERKQAEQAIRESEARFRTLFETSPDGVLIDQDRIILYANPAYQYIFGIKDLASHIGKPFDPIVASEDLERVKAISAAREAGEEMVPTNYEFTGVREDGTEFPVEVTAARFKHEGRPATMAILRDITGRKALQEQLLLSERLAAIGQVAAGVAHEVNTPLSSITLLAENLLQTTEDETTAKVSKQVIEQVDFAAHIVRDLLNFARPSSPSLDDLDLHPLLEAALEQIGTPAWLKLERRLAPELPSLKGDRVHLQEVFTNLIRNAIDAMAVQGKGILTIKTRRLDSQVEVTIRDSGPGIPVEDLEHIFEPFFSTKPAGRGTGLGLPLVQRFVHDHGGTVNVKSKPGLGTRVIVTLPFKPPEAEGGGLVEED